MARILIIEDNIDLANGLQSNLELEDHVVSQCHDGAEAKAAVLRDRPDLIVLDMMLPHRDGLAILRELRDNDYPGAILVLTARGEEWDKVQALRLGADDYVTKPFGLMELLARVQALLRRNVQTTPEQFAELRFADIHINHLARVVTRAGEPVALTPKEYELLLALVQQPDRVLSRAYLLREIWGHKHLVLSRTVDTHIAELRRKLETDPSRPRHILTVRSVGYRFHP